MKVFDASRLRTSYVKIMKITSNFVYVASDRNGGEYAPKGSKADSVIGVDVHKIRIHPSVYQGFKRHNYTSSFPSPKLASLNYYDNRIVSVEVQLFNHRINGFQDSANWKSNFAKVIVDLKAKLEDISEPYINGSDIYWVDDSSAMSISLDGMLHICAVNYISLSKMGLSIDHLESQSDEVSSQATGDAIDAKSTSTMLSVNSGKVLRFNPTDDIKVYSPPLCEDMVNTFSSRKIKDSDSAIKASLIASKVNVPFVNVHFALKATKVITNLYGIGHVEFLDIPSIIEKTGCVNFHDIDPQSRKEFAIDITAYDALAWICKFIYQEKDIDKLRELTKLFRSFLKNGMVFTDGIHENTFYVPENMPLKKFAIRKSKAA